MMESIPAGKTGSRFGYIVLVAIIVAVAALSGYLLLQNSMLSSELSGLRADYNSLAAENSALTQDYSTLSDAHAALQANYSSLNSYYNSLSSKYSSMGTNYQELDNYLYGLSDILDSYAFFPHAINRTLTDSEISKISSTTYSAVAGTTDSWEAERRIYNYIRTHIAYESDISVPYLDDFRTVSFDGESFCWGFEVRYFDNYVQAPELTVSNGYGDCEDQAILAYAMMKYFERNIQGPEYSLYLAYVEFNDGEAHVCVIRPATGGYAFILDPAGIYLTPNYGYTSAKKALQELQSYSLYWDEHGGIENITLYRVTDDDGNYVKAGEGTISEIAAFFT